MEKYRFYVELPGDLWEDGTFMDLIRMNAAPLVRLHMSPSEAHRAVLHGLDVCMVVGLDREAAVLLVRTTYLCARAACLPGVRSRSASSACRS